MASHLNKVKKLEERIAPGALGLLAYSPSNVSAGASANVDVSADVDASATIHDWNASTSIYSDVSISASATANLAIGG